MTAIISFFIAITILVFVHEFGHYIIAKFCGVKVLRFSIGFGSPIFKKTDSHGTEWVFSAIPLGGYVTMWDHLNTKSDGKMHDEKQSFSNKTIFARSLIVLGGPMANFIFAIFAFTFIFSFENDKTMPIIDTPIVGSISHTNGLEKNDKIIRINDINVDSFEQIEKYLNEFFRNSDSKLPLVIYFLRNKVSKKVFLNVNDLKYDSSEIFTKKIGLLPRSSGVRIVDVVDNSVAKKSGLKKGDIIISIDGAEVNFPNQVTDIIRGKNKGLLELNYTAYSHATNKSITRNNENEITKVNAIFDRTNQVLGVYLMPNTQKFISSLSLGEAFQNGVKQTFKVINLCLSGIYKIFTSASPFEQIGGPVSIANAAENSANSGLLSFLAFLAFLSVSIGVINLLPIPILDGGHLLYHVIEFIKGSPLSSSFKSVGTFFGLMFIVGLTFLAVSNDILRFLKL